MVAEVHTLHRAPPLTDIAGRLRDFAMKVEAGEVSPDMVLILFRDNDTGVVDMRQYGECLRRHEVMGIVQDCANRIMR